MGSSESVSLAKPAGDHDPSIRIAGNVAIVKKAVIAR
jgi:hypothetical protein